MKESLESTYLDQHLRLRLAVLDPRVFEQFFLQFFNSGISLAIDRDGTRVERRVIEANTYAAGSGRADKGVDLIAKMEGGETWAFQCKQVKSWNIKQTNTAMAAATFSAQHYFLLVACDPHKDVQDHVARHLNWSFWNLDRICQEFRMRVPAHIQPRILNFLTPEELRRFAPYATDALVPAQNYFAMIQAGSRSFHHGYPLVGREDAIATLRSFATDNDAKVLKISAKGGEGKTRLLWEMAKVIPQNGAPEVWFLNPHATGDLSLALWRKQTPRIVVVDDAHRIERVSAELLGRVRADPLIKLLLATRSQGDEAVEARLREHGFGVFTNLELAPLRSKDRNSLAEEALGPAHRQWAKELIVRTGDSPFLIAMSGDLIRRGQLKWTDWHSDDAFRAEVFRSFETDNLDQLGETDRAQGARLLRLIALLAPVNPDAVFHERAARCLEITAVEIEALLMRLQAAGVISAEAKNIRVIPDLFADFLVFDTIFDPDRRLPVFARAVLDAFKDESASLLRNLAEAYWIASLRATNREEMMRPLLEAEFARFDDVSFFERSRIVERWATFSVYLPAEALELAEKAYEQKTAPKLSINGMVYDADDEGIDSHRHLLAGLPALLKPVALWHSEYRDAALDLLWKQGVSAPEKTSGWTKNHPWNVIAEVLKFTPRKGVDVSASTIEWIAGLVRRPSVREIIESNRSVLGTLLEPCFARVVEFSEWKGRTVSWWNRPVNREATAPVRDRALAILNEIVETGSWRMAIDAVGALERAMRRVGGIETGHVENIAALMELWRPEREKALKVLAAAIAKHEHPVFRFAARQALQRDIAYEEDEVFAVTARAVLASIVDDLDLRIVSIINSQGYFEFAEELGAPKGEKQAQIKERWHLHIGEVADRFAETWSHGGQALARLNHLASESMAVGYSPRFIEFLPEFSRRHPALALAMLDELLREETQTGIMRVWHQLLFGLREREGEKVRVLVELASRHPNAIIRGGVVEYFRFRERMIMTLDDGERALLENMASRACGEEVLNFVELVDRATDTCAEWSFELLCKLRLKDLPSWANGAVLSTLNPCRVEKVVPAEHVVRHVLDALVAVPEIKADHHGGGFERAKALYPRAVYDFVLARIAHHKLIPERTRYQILPHAILERFQLRELAKQSDFPALCDFVWGKVMSVSEDDLLQRTWLELFQGIAMEHEELWLPKLLASVYGAASLDDLRRILEVVHFDGSLVIFGHPELTSAVLLRAEDLAGKKGYKKLRSTLYCISGPSSRGYSNGELDDESDYMEAEAIKAAATHATDPVLGPFYQWISDVEKHEREDNLRRYADDMTRLDED